MNKPLIVEVTMSRDAEYHMTSVILPNKVHALIEYVDRDFIDMSLKQNEKALMEIELTAEWSGALTVYVKSLKRLPPNSVNYIKEI